MEEGRCIYGCILTKSGCKHLNKYLKWDGFDSIEEPPVLHMSNIDESVPAPETQPEQAVVGTWELFKKLRKYGMRNDQIVVILHRVALGKTFGQISVEQGWADRRTPARVFASALKQLERRGFKGGLE